MTLAASHHQPRPALGRTCVLAAAALLLGGLSQPTFAATALGAGMDLRVVVGLGDSSARNQDGADWLMPDLSPVSGAVSVSLENNQGDFVQGQLSGEATWSSANRGRVEMRAAGWTFDVDDTSARVTLHDGNRDWRYAFLAGAKDTLFTMDYIVAGFGENMFGLEGWIIRLSGGPEGEQQESTGGSIVDPSAFGSFSASLTPGHAYVVSLRNGADLSTSNADRTASMWGTFDWQISTAPVPEPGTWALFGAGLLALGAWGRRRDADA